MTVTEPIASETVPPFECLDCHHGPDLGMTSSGRCMYPNGDGICGCQCRYPANPNGVPW